MRFNMGRLFWKFFFFFFLAQFTAVIGVGLTVWIDTRNHESAGIEAGPPARSAVEAASATLKFGGVKGMQALLDGWQKRRMPQVYAVDETGREMLQRPYSETTLQAATEIVESLSNERYVKRVSAEDGHQYLIFVPRFARIPERDARPLLEADDKPGGNASDSVDGPPPHETEGRGERGRPLRLFPFKPLMAGAVASLFFAALLAWYFSKPIRHLRAAFEEAARGHLDTRVGNAIGSRRDELADLGRDFDSMAGRLGNLMRGQTRLLHHVSHELRSPLARLQMAIGLARQSPEKIASSLDRIERESERMDKLVGELLELSRLESGVTSIDREEVDVSELLKSIVEDARFEAEAMFPSPSARPVIQLNEASRFILRGQPELLHRAIENIIRNALKYSPPDGTISIESSQVEEGVMRLLICDEGQGVPESELQSIFQPFVRGSTATNADGHGVGLAIAKQVVEAHGGTIVAKNLTGNAQTLDGNELAKTGFALEIQLPYLAVLPA